MLSLAGAASGSSGEPSVTARERDEPIVVPVQLIDHVFVPADIDGRGATLLYDPVQGLMLDKGFAARRSIVTVDGEAAGMGGPVRVGGAGASEYEVRFARGLHLTVGGQRVDVPLAPVIPLDSSMATSLGRHVDGLIGLDLLGDRIVELDFDRRQMRLHRRAGFAPPAEATVLPIRLLGGKPIVQVDLEITRGRRLPASMVLDFGMGGTLRLSTRFTDAHELISGIDSVVPSHDETGLGGALESRIGRLAALTIGNLTVREPIVSLARERTGGDAAPPYDGLIGIGLLRRFRIFVDLGAKRVILLPTARSARPFVYAPTGVVFEPLSTSGTGPLVVRSVRGGTFAARAGLLSGDTLLAVGGRATRAWTRRDWQDAVDDSEGKPLHVTVSRGGRRLALTVAVAPLLPSERQ